MESRGEGQGVLGAKMSQTPVLSMDSDTETPRKGPLALPGEVVRSSLSPRSRDAQAAADKTAVVGAHGAARAGRGTMSPAQSPVKSLASQTQLYESPSRRRIALSQNNFSDSEHTLVYVEARALVESQSQRTAQYVEPRNAAPADRSSQQQAASSPEGEGRRQPQESAQSVAEVRDLEEQNRVNVDASKVEERDAADRADCEYYQALLPNMSSQLTPASQPMASQTQHRYDKLTTFGPETLHQFVPFAPSQRKDRELGVRGVRSAPLTPAENSRAVGLQGKEASTEGQETAEAGQIEVAAPLEARAPAMQEGCSDRAESSADASRGSATSTREDVSQPSPKVCRLSVSEQGMHETPNLSLSPEDQGNRSKVPAAHDSVGGGAAADLQHERQGQSIMSKGKAAQLEREKLLMLSSPALDDLSSQDFRFAVPAGRAPTSAQVCAPEPPRGNSKQVAETRQDGCASKPAPAAPCTSVWKGSGTCESSAPVILPDASAATQLDTCKAVSHEQAREDCQGPRAPVAVASDGGRSNREVFAREAKVLEVAADVTRAGACGDPAAHPETKSQSHSRKDGMHAARNVQDDMDEPTQEESPVLSHKQQGRAAASQKQQPPQQEHRSACSKPAKDNRGPAETARTIITTPKPQPAVAAAVTTSCGRAVLPGASTPTDGRVDAAACEGLFGCAEDAAQDAAAEIAPRMHGNGDGQGTDADSGSVIVLEDGASDVMSLVKPALCSPGRRREADEKMDEEVQEKGRGVAGSSKRAKGGGATPGCCYKCAATKSVEWHPYYVDGLTMQICKTCRGYHKDNEIVNRALLPEEPEVHDAGLDESCHQSNFRARRVQEQQSVVDRHMTMDGSQIYANSQQAASSTSHLKSNLISGKCSRCAATHSTGWYDDENQMPLSLCALCRHKRSRPAAASPRKRSRTEGEGIVTFSPDSEGHACGSNAGRAQARSPWKSREQQLDTAFTGAQGHREENDEEEGSRSSGDEAGYGQMMMSQAFGDDEAQPDDGDHDEFGPSSDEEEEEEGQERGRGVFAGHSFLVTGVEVEEKRVLRERILSHGGQLVDCSTLEPGKEPDKLLLLTGAPCKTSNFLCGLAVGVCVVSTQWVADCLASKQLCPIDSYRLDAAVDDKTRRRIKVPKHFGSSPMELHKRVLGGKRVAIIGNRPFQNDHILMVKFAGAEVVDTTHEALHYIICESSTKFRPTSSQINSAHRRSIPLVSSEWLCACVRQQALVDVEGYRVAQLANGARIRLSFQPAVPQAAAPPATAQSQAALRVVLTATPTEVQAVQMPMSDSEAPSQDQVWVVEQAPADQLRSTRRFALRSQATGQYLSTFEKGGPVSFDEEAAFCEHLTIHELPASASEKSWRSVRLETCHKNWIVAKSDGSVCDSKMAPSKMAPDAPGGCGAVGQDVFDLEILGFGS